MLRWSARLKVTRKATSEFRFCVSPSSSLPTQEKSSWAHTLVSVFDRQEFPDHFLIPLEGDKKECLILLLSYVS